MRCKIDTYVHIQGNSSIHQHICYIQDRQSSPYTDIDRLPPHISHPSYRSRNSHMAYTVEGHRIQTHICKKGDSYE